jgi:HK97 family phage major capsid protein
MLKARPVNIVEQCQALGTLGDILLLDLSQYLVIDKGAMQSAESIHVRFVNDEDTFRFTYRVDGQPLWSTTLTSFNSGTTRSPFVGLASR